METVIEEYRPPAEKKAQSLRAALRRRSVGPRPAVRYMDQLSRHERDILFFLRDNGIYTARALRIIRSLGVRECLFSGGVITFHEQDLFRINQQLTPTQLKELNRLIYPCLRQLLLDPIELAGAVQMVIDSMPRWRSVVPTSLPLEEIAEALRAASNPGGGHSAELRRLFLILHENDCGRHDVLEFFEGKANGLQRFQLLLDGSWDRLLEEARLYGPIPF